MKGNRSLPSLKVFAMSKEPYPPRLVTVGVIASEVGASVDRVCRLLRNRPHIKPRAFAGNTRLFDNAAVAQVRYELNKIDARRAEGGR